MAFYSSVIGDKFPPRDSAPAPTLARVRRPRLQTVVALLLVTGALVANEQPVSGDVGGLPGTIDVLTVKPVKIAPAVLMPNAQVPGAPPPIDAAQRAAWLAGQATQATELSTIVLSPATLSVADRAQLVLTRPLTVHPETTVEFAADPDGMASVRLKVQAGATYLLDFAVSGLGQGVYTLAAESGQREFDDPEGAPRHLLIGLKAEATGWTGVRLQRSGAGFHLHSVEISGAL